MRQLKVLLVVFDIIVKFMLNEKEVSIPVKTDIAPFYHWKDVRAFYKDLLSQLPDRL